MLLVPEFPIVEDVFDLKEFKQANRHLIIYKNVNNDFLSDYQFTVINNSVQVGGRNKLAHNETLFCSHFYFGTVDKPFVMNQNGEQVLNPNAILIVKEHSYIHKLVQQISDDEKTVNIFDGTYKNEYARYGNTGDMVLPPDIRYYTLDHQILKEHCDTPFGTDERQLEMKARINQGMFYILKEIIDPYTIISFVPIKHYDNPDSLGTKLAMAQILSNKTNNQYIPSEIQSWIIGAITRLINYTMLTFITHIKIIFDADKGYNIYDIKRNSFQIPKEYNHWEYINFITELEYEWTTFCEMGYRARFTLIYDQEHSHVLLESLDAGLPSSSISNIARDTHGIVEQNYLGTVTEER